MEGTAGETSQMLLVALNACGDITEFCECLRDVIESPLIMECEAAIQIISQVYIWMGLKLSEFM
jgi:hypothetical protein